MGLSSALSSGILSNLSLECVSKGRLLAKVLPLSRSNGYPLINTFYQPEFEAVLLEGLQRFSCVEVRFQHTLEALEQSTESIIVSIRTPTGTLQQVQCAYLLACDGGRSMVRRSLNIPLQGATFAQRWLVIDAICGEGTAPVVTIFCNPQRPAVAIPAPHNRRRWEFMLLPGETEKDLLEPTTISALLQQYTPRKTTASAGPYHIQIVRQAIYTFHAARAKSFSQGRVFLLGDAAHMMPPFGGQGLNSALRDAQNLAWKVAMVLQAGDHKGSSLLTSYHEERSRHAARMVAFASILGALFMSTARPLAYCRNLLIRMLHQGDHQDPATLSPSYHIRGNLLMRMKPQAKYRAGFFLGEVTGKHSGRDKSGPYGRLFKRRGPIYRAHVGSLLPQPEVITRQGQRVLLDEVLGTGFALLRRHANPEEAFAKVQSDFWQQLGARLVCIQTEDPPKKSGVGARFIAPTGSQALPIVVVRSMDKDFLSKSRDCFVVVRPDRFILGVFKEEKANAFESALQRLLYSDGE